VLPPLPPKEPPPDSSHESSDMNKGSARRYQLIKDTSDSELLHDVKTMTSGAFSSLASNKTIVTQRPTNSQKSGVFDDDDSSFASTDKKYIPGFFKTGLFKSSQKK